MLLHSSCPWEIWTPMRGEIYLVDLGSDNMDCEQQGIRPVVILSNNIGNQRGSIVVIAPLTTRSKDLPIHVQVGKECGLKKNSYIMSEHIRSLSKRRFFTKSIRPVLIGTLTDCKIKAVDAAIKLELALTS